MQTRVPGPAAKDPVSSLRQSLDVDFDLQRFVDTLLEGRYWIIGIAAIFLMGACLYLWAATPVYSTDASIQLERPKQIVGGADEMSRLGGGSDPRSSAEIEIIRSRS